MCARSGPSWSQDVVSLASRQAGETAISAGVSLNVESAH